MDAVKFIKTVNRMCEYYGQCDKPGCPLKSSELNCDELSRMVNDEEKIVSRVEEWDKEHPIKTRQSEFLRLFPFYPKTGFNVKGILTLDPCSVDNRFQGCQDEFTCDYECNNCCEKYWTKEID